MKQRTPPIDKEAIEQFIEDTNKSTERVLSMDELIDNYNEYYKKYKEYEKRALKAEDKLKKISEKAKYYFRICNGAGGQSMNIMDRHFGMAQVGKEILEILKGE